MQQLVFLCNLRIGKEQERDVGAPWRNLAAPRLPRLQLLYGCFAEVLPSDIADYPSVLIRREVG
jgi:hypothetical protein